MNQKKCEMENVVRVRSEYGGYLPLELNPGREYFDDYINTLKRFNSVKASLDYLIEMIGVKKIFIPYYYCPSTIEAIRNTGIYVAFYHVNDELMPINVPDECESAVLLVDYFGVCCEKINGYAASFVQAEVIIDRAHDFFSMPFMSAHVYNIYSAKKFFGIPDGAYLIGEKICQNVQDFSLGYSNMDYLVKAYEMGTNAAYAEKKLVDNKLRDNYACMSIISIGLLKNVNYERVKTVRENNYRVLRQAFDGINELELPLSSAAYQFPLLLSDCGARIKKHLVENNIFVSTLWAGKDLIKDGNTFEINMKDNSIFLPMDQRYDEYDMLYIIDQVKKIMKEK